MHDSEEDKEVGGQFSQLDIDQSLQRRKREEEWRCHERASTMNPRAASKLPRGG